MTVLLRTIVSIAISISMLAPPAWGFATGDGAPGRTSAPAVRLVGPQGEATPVVNERGKLRLTAVDAGGRPVAVSSWACDSPEIAKMSRKGVLKGRRYGIATITARTALGDAIAFAVVVRVGDRPGSRAQGDTKADTSGNVYLSSPRENVIFRATGLRDEVFAGSRQGQAGYREGHGEQARFSLPTGLGVDNRAEGGVYVADTANHCVRRIDFGGNTTAALGRPEVAGAMPLDVTPIAAAAMNGPRGVASVGRNFYFTDTENHAVYYADFQRDEVVLVAGQPQTAGLANGRGREARFNRPSGLAINSDGSLLAVADTGNDVVRLISIVRAPDGRVTGEVATLGQTSSARAVAMAAAWREDRGEDVIAFDRPESVSLDGTGNVYVIDATGASVVTRPRGRLPEKIDLAQAGSLGDPASVTVSGTRALVLDQSAPNAARAVKVVEVGPPAIASVAPNVDVVSGGREAVIDGSNFAPESKLTLGDAEVTDYTVESARRIVFRVPAQQATGGRTLSVITRGGVAQAAFYIRPRRIEEIAAGDITTVAGAGLPYQGDGRRAEGANVSITPGDMAIDGIGNVFISDAVSDRIRRIDAVTGIITTVAGNGTRGFGGDGGLAPNATFNEPVGIAVDQAGNLFICDSDNNRVRRVDALTGIIDTIAGNGIPGFGGDGGPARDSMFWNPTSVVVDSVGNLFIADTLNGRIRRVDAVTAVVTTLEGTYQSIFGIGVPTASGAMVQPSGHELALDVAGNLYFLTLVTVGRVDAKTGVISIVAGTNQEGFGGDGGPALEARLKLPSDLVLDAAGNLYIADTRNGRIRRVDSESGLIATVVGLGAGDYNGDGLPARETSLLSPEGVAIDASGAILIGDAGVKRLRRVDPVTDRVSTVAGNGELWADFDGEQATSAAIAPSAIAADQAGNLFVAESLNNRVSRIDAETGMITTIAGTGIPGFSGDGGPAVEAQLDDPVAVAVDLSGKLYVLDRANYRVRRIDPASGIITTVAGNGSFEFSGDGGPATAAGIALSRAIAVDAEGNLFISGYGRVRKIDVATGIIDTVAGNGDDEFNGDGHPAVETAISPNSLVIDAEGNLFIDDSRHFIWKVGTDGIARIYAGNGTRASDGDGGPATEASTWDCFGLATDQAGNLFLSDYWGGRVRRVDASTGIITTVAGGGQVLDSDGGPALAAELRSPNGVAMDGAGNLYFAEYATADLQAFTGKIRAVRGAGQANASRRR
jgi:DNA-binding beta-propeller fold protein YncE